MPICPVCNGNEKGFAFVNRGPSHKSHTQEEIVCLSCNGQGTVSAEMAERINTGKEMRDRRLAQGLTLRQAASNLGVLPSQLSAVEHGIKENLKA